MIPITEIVKGFFKIGPLDTKRGTPWTSPYLVVGQQRAAIVEPGELEQTSELLEGIKEIGVDLDRIAYLIPTHIHLHHVSGVNVLLKEIPQAKVVVHQRAVPHLMEPSRLNASTLEVWGQDRGCSQLTPVPEDRILGVVGDEVIDLGGRELEIIDARGHAPHHIAIFDRVTRIAITGDAAGDWHTPGRERAEPDIRPPLFNVEMAVDSVRRLRALQPSMLIVFGRGGVNHSPDKALQWLEADIRAVERICQEGMKQKLSNEEIISRVREYYRSVEIELIVGAPMAVCAYLHKQDPSLEMPQ